ncbi:TPA: distal tail protein Dit [Streptococcus pyogenes]|uniref:distal tail protein Dit n=1 Tax=Streptococcus pyogenes TaxID=1314 RepID=UPI000D707666|nr:distal tail protein Dit [Streptococcus pyogenes]PWU77612.1 phage tail protein [Streptococcus pyogenes]HEP1371339.1 phage tail family protein [Streptococcus pyogenes]HEP1989343.1 phage tail family protein [Streptococcus pyogenes]HEP4849665.1 phage tail family protein [Streptococcus pyogenes]HEQ8367724.1 phage tail family protein [Streptococcus pyogenes]
MRYIEFNGTKSNDLGLLLERERSIKSTNNDVDLIEVAGRDGVLIKDNERLKAVEQDFPFSLVGDVTANQQKISEWLHVKGWHGLVLSWDKDYIYRASVVNLFEIDEILKQFGRLKVNFLIHPIKYLKMGKQEVSLVKGGTLQNPGNVQAKPILKIKGTGSGVLTINGFETGLENVQGELVIDMERHLVYKGALSAWDNIVRTEHHRMPLFDVGQNKISWTGDFTITAIPNWGVKV